MNPDDVPEVMRYLDHREKGGYSTHELQFFPLDPSTPPFTVLVYIATQSNPNYLGPSSAEAIAKQVVDSSGQSGHNSEYVLRLAKAMRDIAPEVEDAHLFCIEMKVTELMQTNVDHK